MFRKLLANSFRGIPLTRLRAEAPIVSGCRLSLRRAKARPTPTEENAGAGHLSPKGAGAVGAD